MLEVARGRTGEVLYRYPVRRGEEFKLIFTHSVTLRQIEEIYRVTADRQIAIKEMVFDEPGPNLPASPEGNTKWIFEKDHWRVVDYDTVLPEIPLLVAQQVADHRLKIGGKIVSLVQLAGPGQDIKIRAARVSIAEFAWKGGFAWLNPKK
ncbi:MAG: DUF1850 domain-containing protein [Bacillota bacterium]